MRVFIALELDPRTRRDLARAIQRLDDGARGVRWVRPEQLHLTLKFLGDVPETEVPEACDLLDELADSNDPFDMTVRGLGCFPEQGAVRILWAGLDEPTGRLERLQRDIEELFAGEGYQPEHREFMPHITIARVKEGAHHAALRERIAARGDFRGGISHVKEIVFFQSILGRDGAQYAPISRHVLGGADQLPD